MYAIVHRVKTAVVAPTNPEVTRVTVTLVTPDSYAKQVCFVVMNKLSINATI